MPWSDPESSFFYFSESFSFSRIYLFKIFDFSICSTISLFVRLYLLILKITLYSLPFFLELNFVTEAGVFKTCKHILVSGLLLSEFCIHITISASRFNAIYYSVSVSFDFYSCYFCICIFLIICLVR